MDTYDEVRAPAWPVAAQTATVALSAAGAGLALVTPTPSLALAGAGYVLGAIVVTVLAAVYRASRDARRGHGAFRPSRLLDRASTALVVCGLAAGIVNAYALATEIAK